MFVSTTSQRNFAKIPAVCLAMIALLQNIAGNDANSPLDAISNNNDIFYVGCFHVWEQQHVKLEVTEGHIRFDQSHGRITCAEKCLEKNLQPQLVFIRGLECHCAPVPANSIIDAYRISDGFCNYKCPLESASKPTMEDGAHLCGGNIGYSVYCISASTNVCRLLESGTPPEEGSGDNPVTKVEMVCGLCQGIYCTPDFTSPVFDYFPRNNLKHCATFCNLDINYIEWDASGAKHWKIRHATRYAALFWWKVLSANLTLPVCWCSKNITGIFFNAPGGGYCNGTCPGGDGESCGGYSSEGHEIFGSVYCIEDGSGRCNFVGTSTTTTTTTEQSYTPTSPPSSSTTNIPTTELSTITEEYSTTTYIETTSTFPSTLETTSSRSTITASTSTIATSSLIPTMITTDDYTTSTYTTEPTEGSSTLSPVECVVCCHSKDHHGYHWKACANRTQRVECSELISGSSGKAYWKCNKNGKFASPQPDVSRCKSQWVQDMEKQFDRVVNMHEAYAFTSKLSIPCSDPQKWGHKYFGHEIANITSLMNRTLWEARRFTNPVPSQEDFQNLVNDTMKLHACLINNAEPWNDLSLVHKSYLSTRLMLDTENALFLLTEYVNPNQQRYMAVFTPIREFTAAAETFDRNNDSVRDKAYEFPKSRDPNRESCIRLPEGWTGHLTGDKVEIAIVTIAPETVAQVMTGSKVYEVNGQKNKIINGRIISLSVSSSGSTIDYAQKYPTLRSKSLDFSGGKGVEIVFHHNFDVDLSGEQTYDIRRDLHDGETPKAVLKSAECTFWDVNKNMWSTKGCKVVKTSRVESVCECSHLTSFAVLMDVHNYVGKQLGLTILTLILCPLSELALICTIVILFIMGNGAYKVRTTICKHLSFCLFLGNGMILVFLDRHYFYMNDTVCIGAAMITHYVFLCAFMWMLFEGVQLYRMVVNVFDSGKNYMRHFGIIAYGTPLLIIAITAALGHLKGDQPYGGNAYCWLLGDYIWTFMVPVAIVITINLITLFIALKTAYQLQHQGQSRGKLFPMLVMEKIRSYRLYFRGCFSLTVILGITWVVGFFTLMEGSGKIIAAYLFTILNASQGFFIFLFTCRTYKVRLYTQRKFSTYFPSIIINSNSNPGSMIIKKPFVISKS